MKRLLHFSLPQAIFASQPLEFKEVSGGFEVEMMIFSTADNRNKAYFQVSNLMKWQKKLDSIMFNFNHDLRLSGGKYLGNQNKFTALRADYSTGELEIFANFRTTDPIVVAKKTEITAPSVELMVNDEDCICNEFGQYFTEIDWVGCALLLGVVAGSGNARVGEIKDFKHLSTFNTDQNMTKEEIQELLNAQAETLTATFKAENEANLKTFGEVVAQSQRASEGTYEYTDDDGNKYRCTSKDMYQSITELIEKGTVSGGLTELMKAKKLEVKAFNTETSKPVTDVTEPTLEELEDQEILAQVQASLKTAEKREEILKQFKDSKQVANRDNDVVNVVSPEFKLKSQIQKNLSNII